MEIINDKNFEEKIKTGVVLVDFFATWCGPCRMLAPTLEALGEKLADKIAIYKVDVDESEKIARNFGIMSIPTLIVFKDGTQVDKHVGFMNEDDLSVWLQKWL